MATKIEIEQRYAATPAQVRAMLTSAEYATVRAERTGALSVTASVEDAPDGSCTMRVERELPAEVPSFAKSFVGPSLKVDERYTWQAPVADGTGHADFSADFSAPMSFLGTVTIEADGDGAVVRVRGEIKAAVPIIGGKVEGFAKDSMERYLRAEQRVGTEWLTTH